MSTANVIAADRWNWVDSAKGLGIILVVYGHVARGLFNAGIYTDVQSFTLIDNFIYSFHMPLFFFLSGLFCINSFEKRGYKLVFSKIDAIFYPYLLWSLIQGSVEIALSNLTNKHLSWAALQTIFWLPRAQFWFLYTLFFIFLFNIALLLLIKQRGIAKQHWPLILLVVAAIFEGCKSLFPGIFLLQSLAAYDVYFAAGAMFWWYGQSLQAADIKVLGVLIGLFLATEYAALIAGLLNAQQPMTSVLLAGLGIAAAVGIAQRSAIFAWLGRYSMEIYLMHIIFGSGIRIVLQKGWAISSMWIHLLLGVVLGIALPILFTRCLLKWKMNFLFSPPKPLSLGQ